MIFSCAIGVIKICSCNVPKNLNNVVEQFKFNFDLIPLQKTKLKENCIAEIDDCMFFNSEGEKQIFGTAFIMNNKLKQHTIK